MQIEMINENLLRVVLTPSDLEENNIDLFNMSRLSFEFRDMCFRILDKAKRELNFTLGDTFSVEAFTTPFHSGLILIISRVSYEDSDGVYTPDKGLENSSISDSGKIEDITEYELELLRTSTPVDTEPYDLDNTLIYEFSDFEHLVQVAVHFKHHGIPSGSVYHYNRRYHLVLSRHKLFGVNEENLRAILTEFGIPSKATIYVLRDYGKPIFESNALDNIWRKFVKN